MIVAVGVQSERRNPLCCWDRAKARRKVRERRVGGGIGELRFRSGMRGGGWALSNGKGLTQRFQADQERAERGITIRVNDIEESGGGQGSSYARGEEAETKFRLEKKED